MKDETVIGESHFRLPFVWFVNRCFTLLLSRLFIRHTGLRKRQGRFSRYHAVEAETQTREPKIPSGENVGRSLCIVKIGKLRRVLGFVIAISLQVEFHYWFFTMANITCRPHYQMINGIWFPSMFSPNCIKEAFNYKPKPEDVVVVTYPKCGTTWMQNIALYIFRKGKELENHRDFFKMCPFIDALGNQGINRMPRPGAFKTHLPYNHMPYSPDAKYIYVMRNPKDCCTSFYHHAKMAVGFGFWDGKFDDFFELFMAGEVEYNDYFDHLVSFYPHRNDSQIFFTTYEDMKKDTKDVVLKLAKFLGQEYIDAIQKDNNVLNNILNFSSFDYLRKNISDLYDSTLVTDEQLDDPHLLEGERYMIKYGRSLNPPSREKMHFIRKGIVGDWKTQLSEEQSERLSKKFFERTHGTEIQEMYKSYI